MPTTKVCYTPSAQQWTTLETGDKEVVNWDRTGRVQCVGISIKKYTSYNKSINFSTNLLLL